MQRWNTLEASDYEAHKRAVLAWLFQQTQCVPEVVSVGAPLSRTYVLLSTLVHHADTQGPPPPTLPLVFREKRNADGPELTRRTCQNCRTQTHLDDSLHLTPCCYYSSCGVPGWRAHLKLVCATRMFNLRGMDFEVRMDAFAQPLRLMSNM